MRPSPTRRHRTWPGSSWFPHRLAIPRSASRSATRRARRRLGAVADAGLGEDAVDVGLHRGLADHQALGDLEVGSQWTSSRRAIGRSGGLSGARQAGGVEDDRVSYGWSSVCLGVGDSAVLSLASGSSPDSRAGSAPGVSLSASAGLRMASSGPPATASKRTTAMMMTRISKTPS
jgi:hypothetical protein